LIDRFRGIQRPVLITLASYAGLTALSTLYILIFRLWDMDGSATGSEIELSSARTVMAAGMYGAIFWLLIGSLVYLIVSQFEKFGRRVFAAGALLISVLWLFAWPGFLDADSYSNFGTAGNIYGGRWHGPIPIVIASILQHLPFVGLVGWFQAVFFIAAIAYALQTLRTMFRSCVPGIALVVLTACSLPLLYNLTLVVRETWVAIITLFLAVEAIRYFNDADWRDGKAAGRILLLCFLACYFRSEALVYLPVALFGIAVRHFLADGLSAIATPEMIRTAVRMLSPAIIFLVFAKILVPIGLPGSNSSDEAARYQMSIWIDPVGSVLTDGDDGLKESDLEVIYASVPPEHFSNWHSKSFREKFFAPLDQGVIRVPTGEEAKKAQRAAFRIVLSRPAPFLESRTHEFSIVNAPFRTAGEVAIQPTQAFIDSQRAQRLARDSGLGDAYSAIIPAGRRFVERFYVEASHTGIGRAEWALLPDLFVLLVAMVLLPWRPGLAFAGAIVGARIVPLFLLVPEAQSKYYSSVEFCTPLFIAMIAGYGWQAYGANIRGALSRILAS